MSGQNHVSLLLHTSASVEGAKNFPDTDIWLCETEKAAQYSLHDWICAKLSYVQCFSLLLFRMQEELKRLKKKGRTGKFLRLTTILVVILDSVFCLLHMCSISETHPCAELKTCKTLVLCVVSRARAVEFALTTSHRLHLVVFGLR
jgi:hypothetical protein